MDDVRDPEDQLAEPRAQFIENLGARLAVLEDAIGEVRAAPGAAARRANFQRRAHAMGVAAEALGFATAHAALLQIEGLFLDSPEEDIQARAEQAVRLLDVVPTLVLGGVAPVLGAGPVPSARTPLNVVFFGEESLASDFERSAKRWEIHTETDLNAARTMIHNTSPDAVVIDHALPDALTLARSIEKEGPGELPKVIVIGHFLHREAAETFLRAGVDRVLPKPVRVQTLQRHLSELCRETSSRSFTVAPLGDLTLRQLVQRIEQELERGIVESAGPRARDSVIDLGEGVEVLAAVWGAVARIRELVNERSNGAVSFAGSGPEGAIALDAWGARERRASPAARSEGITSLVGRRIVVADDDPAVAWLITDVLGKTGAEVVVAHDGEHALELAYRTWPDLLISDVLMPGLDGFELCRRLKRDIALHDVPVILLSWKEDLLLRARDLGAQADGYLQKEASEAAIVHSVSQALSARMRLEARFKKNLEVQGRLDTVTPRSILQLSSRLLQNASVAVRDAAFLYEVELRNGRLIRAQRTGGSGLIEVGQTVLGPLLGVRAGRFTVLHNSRVVPPLFEGSLAELSAEPLARARALQALLAGPELNRVARLDVDRERVDPYLAISPAKIRGLVTLLTAGDAPVELARMNGVQIVEATLSDLAVHGGISEVYGQGGEPLLERASAALPGFEERVERTEPVRASAAPVARNVEAPSATVTAPKSKAPPPLESEEGLTLEALPPSVEPTSAKGKTGWSAVLKQSLGSGSRTGARSEPPSSGDLAKTPHVASELTPAVSGRRSSDDAVDLAQAVLGADGDRGNAPRSDSGEPEIRPVLAPGRRSAFSGARDAHAAHEQSVARASEFVERSELLSEPPISRATDSLRAIDPDVSRTPGNAGPRPEAAPASGPVRRNLLPFVLAFTALGISAVVLWGTGPAENEMASPTAAPTAEPPTPTPAPSPAPRNAAEPSQLSADRAPVPASAANLTVKDLDLPLDVTVAAGKGLLEVSTTGKGRIYVDGVFIGPGPERRVPLSAGQHDVRVKVNEQERQASVEIKASRRTRVENVSVPSP